MKILSYFIYLTTFLNAASVDLSDAKKSDLNLTAIFMFLAFVTITILITYYSSKKTKSTSGFYTAGGNITGWQNGMAIAGDYMSAASF